MAISHVESVNGSGNPSATLTFSSAIASGDLVVASGYYGSEAITMSATDNGGTPLTWNTAIGPIDHSGGTTLRGYIFWAVGTGNGATVVTLTASAGIGIQCVGSVFTGFTGTIGVDGTPQSGESNNLTSHNTSGSITTTNAEALLISTARAITAASYTAGTNFTIPSGGTGTQSMIQYRIVGSTGTYDGPFTTAAGESLVTLLAAFSGTAGGGAFTLTADAGSYTQTGTAASLETTRLLTASGGSYVITGTTAALEAARKILASGGSFTLTGTDASLLYSAANRVLDAEAGSFAVTGTAAALKATRVIALGAGTYLVSGTDATLDYSGAVEVTHITGLALLGVG